MFPFLIWVVLSVLVGVYADNKGRSGVGFFFVSMLLSPLVGFVIAIVSAPKREIVAQKTGLKKCSECAEFVQKEARVCRFCGHKLSAETGMSSEQPPRDFLPRKNYASSQLWTWLVILGVLTLFILGIYLSSKQESSSASSTVTAEQKIQAIGQTNLIASVDPNTDVLAFVSEDAMDEYLSTSDHARQTLVALDGTGKVVHVPNGTSVVVLGSGRQGWHVWYNVKIVSGQQIGRVVFILDLWTVFR